MKAKLDFKSKRTIIITAIIAVLAIGAGVGGYFYAKGNNQAGATNGVDGSQVTEQASTDTPSNNNPENDGADANNGNGADETTATTNGTTGDNTNGNNGNGATDGNAGNNGNATTGNNGATGNARTNTGRTANGTGNTTNGATTPTNADDTATTTYENVIENIVVEEPWESHSVNWTPEKLNTSIPEVNVNKPQLESSKTAYVQGEEITGKPVNTAIQKGGEITYVINIKNTGDIDASKVMVYDNVPEGTELVNNEEGTIETIKNNDGKDIQRIVWEKDVKAGEEVSVSFTVKVTADSIDLIENTAKVNGKDTDKTKTPVLTSSKKAILVDEDRELEKEESVKVGQKIKYVITAENTSEVDAVTTISDIVPEGTENATEITKPGELKDGTITWKNIPVKAGEKAEVSFVVTVSKDTIKSIKNAAKVADTDTPSVETKVANISTEKRSEASATPLKEEDTITYTLTATNKGDGKGSVIISDEVPTGTSIVGEEGKEVTLTSNSTTKTYSIDELVDGINVELESNETKSLTFTVKINSFTENDENVTTELDKETGIKTSTRIITNAEAKQDGKDIPETTDKVEKEYVKISTRKIWDDQDNQDGIRPDSITINLLENGTKKDSIIVKADEEGNWKYEFINLPKYINDKEVSYTVTEDAVTGYTPATTGNAEEGYTITNTHNVAKTEVSVTKVWEDNDDQDGIRPESITVQLK
ncbi:MAG: Cna B-type domain-containing protein, partial [Clostridia bacterium]|nr:Cna B-type domain-containing protein [Clostridia bacterium]